MKALVQEDPNYVIQRYESGKYAVDDSVTKEYLLVLIFKVVNLFRSCVILINNHSDFVFSKFQKLVFMTCKILV